MAKHDVEDALKVCPNCGGTVAIGRQITAMYDVDKATGNVKQVSTRTVDTIFCRTCTRSLGHHYEVLDKVSGAPDAVVKSGSQAPVVSGEVVAAQEAV